MKVVTFSLFCALSLSGCGKQIEDFVRGPASNPIAPLQGLNSGKTLKISPGQVRSQGPTVGAAVTLTPTSRPVKGTHTDAKLSFHQSRFQ